MLNPSIRKEVKNIISSVFRMNAPFSKGYLFNADEDEVGVAEGMFCDSQDEKDPERWTYYYDFATRRFSTLQGANHEEPNQ